MQCWYMNGAGNDFMVIDARGQKLDFPMLAKKLCKLTGADGFMAVDESDSADFKLHFYNSDGSRGEMCGNGARCICRFAYETGLAGESMVVQTDAGLVPGVRVNESVYRIGMNLPSVVDLQRVDNAAYVELGNPGIPHSITELPDLAWEQKEKYRPLAKGLRHHAAFPKGANANLYCRLDDGNVRILTYERGVEDYTLACGTGSCATAVTLWAKGALPDGTVTVKNPGGDLKVTIQGSQGVVTELLLEGPTEVVKIYEV